MGNADYMGAYLPITDCARCTWFHNRFAAADNNPKTSDSPTPQQNVTSPTRSTAVPFSPSTTRYAPPLSRSPGTASPGTNPNLSMSPPGASTPITRGRQRRGSDSSNSSAGFMDALGPEKWYVGGRNASGEETFYRLGMVGAGQGKRVRSLDRLSL